MNNPFKNALIILTVLALTLLYALYQKQKILSLSSGENGQLMVERLPPFALTSFPHGEEITPEKLRENGAQVLVVHFWGTWCPPCIPEFPEFLEFAKQFTENSRVKFLLVAVRDEKSDVAKFVEKFGDLPDNISLVLDPDGVGMTAFGTVKVPETHYYLKERSAKRFIGPQKWQNTYFAQALKKLLPESQ